MDLLKLTILILALILTGCQKTVELEQKEWTDPLNGSTQIMEQLKIDPWQVITYPKNRDSVLIVKKENGPMLSYDTSGKSQTIMVHPKQNSGHSSVDITDSNDDGIFDKIRFFSGPESDQITMYEANLVNGIWLIDEHTKK
ncbi:hypothetical protein [Marinobacter sp. CHS3-4]|uniref:hypothetical protein n=1 Tax=Marinobacter sp. CHS3-4 TaxID=3045174 RepID=UPI0024B54D74|nr:hypothetical protein [Marinobacter sp. CHS3-4]MDI9246950.1 hypothetical protein [Marinobacter sp. CHS3-4]